MGAPADGRIGIWMTGALAVSSMIGAGIFMLPVSLAPLGLNAVVGWILSTVGALAIAFALARLSRLGGEGIQANIEARLGRTAGFVVAWSFWVANWVSQAAVAIAGASALAWIDPALIGPGFVIPAAIASVVVFTTINAFGVRLSGAASMVTIGIRLFPLLAVIVIFALRGVRHIPYERLAPTPVRPGAISTATAITFFALMGFEIATTPVGKVRDPARTIPRAILGGTLFVAVLYVLASTGVQLILPIAKSVGSSAPFAEAIAVNWNGGAASVAAVAIAIGCFGCLNAIILGSGELGYAMGARGDLPALMTWTWRGDTPVGAQTVASALTVLLILATSSRASTGVFTFVVLLSTAANLVVYLAGALSAWRLTQSAWARTVLIVSLLFIAFAFYGTGVEASLWSIVLLAIGLIVRTIVRRINLRAVLA